MKRKRRERSRCFGYIGEGSVWGKEIAGKVGGFFSCLFLRKKAVAVGADSDIGFLSESFSGCSGGFYQDR
ncbi:hypothetical protein SLEP1_g59249 [Rubroshorea leprosula]|uniref:Uncharacterized protein n=1 Tax=Rubroshorea leprosula TaxID=152421 RepID=A0AAV5MRR5_9ROSI|nr:hypothetical protein SLEP1_g59249 [Rubroshorea leprosula]